LQCRLAKDTVLTDRSQVSGGPGLAAPAERKAVWHTASLQCVLAAPRLRVDWPASQMPLM